MTDQEYRKVHDWIKKHYGKASNCIISPRHIAKQYQWANVSGEYKYDVSDWVELCPACHSAYDRWHLSINALYARERDRLQRRIIVPKREVVLKRIADYQLYEPVKSIMHLSLEERRESFLKLLETDYDDGGMRVNRT